MIGKLIKARADQRMEDDPVLVGRARAGDRAAFQTLIRRHFQRAFRIAFRLLGNREDAEDAAQRCFTRAYEHLDRLRGSASFRSWITKIVVRLCIDAERSRRGGLSMVSMQQQGEAWEPAAPTRGPERVAEQRELLRETDRELQRLPPRLRSALVLRVLEDLPYDAVAEALGTSVRSARAYVFEARQRLSSRLGSLLEEGL